MPIIGRAYFPAANPIIHYFLLVAQVSQISTDDGTKLVI
jgi:hypothetical protein